MIHADFFSGVITAGFVVCSVFFLRFWSQTKESLFLAFALTFALLAIAQAWLVFAGLPREEHSNIYLLRLLAFSILIFAILRKNLGR
jgi:hypothetical protein